VDNGTHSREANRAQLHELASILSSESWIEKISVFPANRPESIVVFLITEHYPSQFVSEVYIEIQSYTNGAFHISYIENQQGAKWMARWDRHESDEYSRDHFHSPPDARNEDGEDQDYPVGLIEVISQVIAPWVYERIGDVWDECE
jgi:hypothetical protein